MSQVLRDLEQRYSGPIPKRMRETAEAGGAHKLRVQHAYANLRFWRGQIRGSIRGIRNATSSQRRELHHDDLAYNLRQYRDAWRELKQARAHAATVEHANHLFGGISRIAAE